MNVNNTAFMFLIVLSLILTITIGHQTLAIKLTATSYSDGIKQGINDALCDINQCHGHGYDPSCPSGHTNTYCSGYTQGYGEEWGRLTGNGNSNSQTRSQNNTNRQGYWTPYDSDLPHGMTAYHIFLDATYPSYINRSTKLVNQNITACLDFNPNYDRPIPSVCHHIKESDIPPTNDSILDVGYFVVPKESHPGVYAKVKYASIKIGEALEGPVHYLDMNYLVYPEVSTVRFCVEDQHIKLNSDKFNECYEAAG